MKHLKKFIESEDENEIDIDYIRNCFIDFTESTDDYDDGVIYIDLPRVKYESKWVFRKPSGIKDMILYANELKNLYEDIDVCIDKVKIRYPKAEPVIEIEFERGNIIMDGITVEDVEFDSYLVIKFELSNN
jgi:hypothetical protein